MRGARGIAGAALRRVAPRSFETLKAVARLATDLRVIQDDLARVRGRVDALDSRASVIEQTAAGIRADLEDARRRGGVADDAIARLHDRAGGLETSVGELDQGLTESRRLSRRVAQLSDLVFDRLVAEDPADRTDEGSAGRS